MSQPPTEPLQTVSEALPASNNPAILLTVEPFTTLDQEPCISGVSLLPPNKWITTMTIACMTCFTFIHSFLAGVVVVAIPTISLELQLETSLRLWCVEFRMLI